MRWGADVPAVLAGYQVEVQTFGEEDHLRGLLNESLDELDPQDRQLVEGKYLGEATVRELSAQTGLTDRAVESRLLRARRDLRQPGKEDCSTIKGAIWAACRAGELESIGLHSRTVFS